MDVILLDFSHAPSASFLRFFFFFKHEKKIHETRLRGDLIRRQRGLEMTSWNSWVQIFLSKKEQHAVLHWLWYAIRNGLLLWNGPYAECLPTVEAKSYLGPCVKMYYSKMKIYFGYSGLVVCTEIFPSTAFVALWSSPLWGEKSRTILLI